MKWPFAVCLVLIAGCRQEDREKESAVFGVRAIPADKALETTKGGTVVIGLQTVDADDIGVDGAPVLFFLGSATEIAFTDHADQRSIRLVTAPSSLDGVNANGLATISITAADSIAMETNLLVYGTLLDDSSNTTIDAAPEATRFDVIEFTITVKP